MNELIAWFKDLFAPICPVCGKQLYRGKCPYRYTSKHEELEDGEV